MLNKMLYLALTKLYNDVEIVNEGESAKIEVTTSDMYGVQWRIGKGDTSGEQYRINCPFCNDIHKHMYISYLSLASPSIDNITLNEGPLMAICFRNNCLKSPSNYRKMSSDIRNCMNYLKIDSKEEDIKTIIDNVKSIDDAPSYDVSDSTSIEGIRTWIPDYNVINRDTDENIINYLINRRVTQKDIDWLNIGWGPIRSPRTGKYLNKGLPWVIIPIVTNGKLSGVQARCPDCYMETNTIKYWLHPACRKRSVLLNIDNARKIGVGVVCEGAFDVISIGSPGVCCFGHTPSKIQENMLTTISKGIIWVPDTDINKNINPIEVAKSYVDKWNSCDIFEYGAHLVKLSEKDAGSMSRQQVWTEILSQINDNSFVNYLLDKVLTNL